MIRPPRIFYLLQSAHSALFRAADQQLRAQYGVTATQQAVLFLLLKQDGQPISTLASALRMGKSSLTALIDRMVHAGLVRRESEAGDGRVVSIFAEPAGRQLAETTLPIVRHSNARLLSPFSDEEQRVIERFLQYVADDAADIISPSPSPNSKGKNIA